MNCTADPSIEDFRRLPGLYRRWELSEVCEPNRNYQIEDAGAHADGTPLLVIYVRDPLPDPSATTLSVAAINNSKQGEAN